MDKFTKYEEVKDRLNVFLERQNILYETDYPSLSIIKDAIKDYYSDLHIVRDYFDMMNSSNNKFINKLGLNKNITFDDYYMYSSRQYSQITFYGKSNGDTENHSITVIKERSEDNCKLAYNTFKSHYDIENAKRYYLNNQNTILNMLNIVEKYEINENTTFINKVPYDIIKITLALNPRYKNNDLIIKIEPNYDYVEDNKETQRAFNKIVPGNEEKMITGFVYGINMMPDKLKNIVTTYCENNISKDTIQKRKKYL